MKYLIVLLIALGVILGVAAILFLFFVIIPAFFGLFVNPNKLYDKDSKFYRALYNVQVRIALFCSRVRIKYEGDDKIPEGRFLLICNHRSNFDPIVTAAAMRKYNLAFISKEENLKLPIFGRIIRRICYMPLVKNDARQAIGIINHAAKLIKDDECSVMVYPEGKRSFSNELLPFHGGVLKIAQKANVPIVVAVIEGTELVRDRFPKKTKVSLRIIDVVSATEAKSKRSVDLGIELHDEMLAVLGK